MAGTTIQLIRHATLKIVYGDAVVLVDPMLAEPGAYPAVPNSPLPRENPLVALPFPVSRVLEAVSLVLVTHTHRDHWDDAAIAALPKAVALGCQPPDEAKIAGAGFAAVAPIHERAAMQGIDIVRTGGQHGRGEVGQRMAPVSGFVFKRQGLPTIYVAGDTVWCEEVDAAIRSHRPDVIVVNAGAAQFNAGGPITMDVDDVVAVAHAAPKARIIAVHMETWNHCVLSRQALGNALSAALPSPVAIPADGESPSLQP